MSVINKIRENNLDVNDINFVQKFAEHSLFLFHPLLLVRRDIKENLISPKHDQKAETSQMNLITLPCIVKHIL